MSDKVLLFNQEPKADFNITDRRIYYKELIENSSHFMVEFD